MANTCDPPRTPPIRRLHADDDVVVVVRDLRTGSKVQIGGETWTLNRSFGLGDKLATRQITKGDPVHRSGVTIGFATTDIDIGDFVHSHNLASNYLTAAKGHNREDNS